MISTVTTMYANIYGGMLVIQAVVITVVMVLALTVYAVCTKTDFTTLYAIIIVVVICFAMFGIVCAVQWNPVLYSLYSTLGAIIAGILLIIDTQMIVGGNKNFQISMDDYILGALVLYIDIVRIFLYILQALGASRR